MNYFIMPSTMHPGIWRIYELVNGYAEFDPALYSSRESAEIACALLNLADE